MEWISIKKKMPDFETEVLCHCAYEEKFQIFKLRNDEEENYWVDNVNFVPYPLDIVTHWQPLPPPPKELTEQEKKRESIVQESMKQTCNALAKAPKPRPYNEEEFTEWLKMEKT